MKTKIILAGKAASGKDYFKDFLTEKGFKPNISHTTRPMRDGEVDGKTYYYISETEFMGMIGNGEFSEHVKFNGWSYGTTHEALISDEVFILTPSGIDKLPQEFKDKCLIIYFDINGDTRRLRLAGRSDSDTIERRMIADEEDFKDFDSYHISTDNPQFNAEDLLATIQQIFGSSALEERKEITYEELENINNPE